MSCFLMLWVLILLLYCLQDDPVIQQETAQCSEYGSSTPPNLHQVDATELGMIIIMGTPCIIILLNT